MKSVTGFIGQPSLVEADVDGLSAERAQEERVTIGCAPGDGLSADDPRRTGTVLHHDRLTQLRGEAFRQEAGDQVGVAARCESDDQADRPCGPAGGTLSLGSGEWER